jgi:cytochrome d ubiquinol oxidase subunit I
MDGDGAAFWDRLQFGFTITYHYLFPQLTMGLAPFLLLWRWRAWRERADPARAERYAQAARFWSVIFAINFVVGVVTGIPMEFQFGTNWAAFSRLTGGVIGQTLAYEGLFAFFLESAFVGLLVYGERWLSRGALVAVAGCVMAGSWLSGYFIIVTNAFMQHPLGYAAGADGVLALTDARAYLLNPWAFILYAHNMTAAVVTGSFVVAAVGAFYTLRAAFREQAGIFLRWGVVGGLVSTVVVAWPTGDLQAKAVARHQEVALAAMEGRFAGGEMAHLTIIGQPDVARRQIDNPIHLPGVLSYLATGSFHGAVRGLGDFPEDQWPTNIALLYYAFHIMVGLGTLMMALMALCALQLLRGRLASSPRLLWPLMLAFPFPYIATTAGWMTAELGRQPWLVFGVLRTVQGASPTIHAGTVVFSLIGFCGLYFVLGVLYLILVGREILRGPGPRPHPFDPGHGQAPAPVLEPAPAAVAAAPRGGHG